MSLGNRARSALLAAAIHICWRRLDLQVLTAAPQFINTALDTPQPAVSLSNLHQFRHIQRYKAGSIFFAQTYYYSPLLYFVYQWSSTISKIVMRSPRRNDSSFSLCAA